VNGTDFENMIQRLDPIHIYLLVHLKRANIDYARSIARTLKMDESVIVNYLKDLEHIGLAERTHGSAIKRTEARLKLSYEVRKHHTYYGLTRLGEHLLREMKKDFGKYLATITDHESTLEILIFFAMVECEHAGVIARVFSMRIEEARNFLGRLVDLGLLTECMSKVLKKKHRKSKLKKETRTHHKYYKLSRLSELLLRYFD
jgi:predicted transcriptional regulator